MSEDDQHFLEDDNSEDDKFEENLEKQYALYPKVSNKRPESKHGRPESSKFSYKKQEQHTVEQQPKPLEAIPTSPALKKFNQLVSFHKILIEQFWKNHTIMASQTEFIGFLLESGFQFEQHEINQILSDLSNDRGVITIESLCKKVPAWHQNENAMLEFIREKALKLAQESKRKFSAQKKPKPQSASTKRSGFNKGDSRPVSGISKKYQSGFSDLKISNINDKPLQNRSKHYLQLAKQKQQEEDRLLQLTINQGKNEYEYEMLIKMGEANELSQELESKITYRAYKTAQGHLKVHVYELEHFQRDLTLEEFQREYNILRSKYNEKKKLKIWEVLNEKKKNQKSLQHFGSSQKEDVKQNEVDAKAVNKKERQQELKKVLLETMMLSNVLKEQLVVLNRKGINAIHNQSVKL
ncbi:unnamed protein product (macronuclear) [Paramecium tetraurelia]|uniref:Uncharacterized protein n=1 Tax=Paramecium tetraurelia TaxID=5888 RepID=A0E6V2_PARTE|nr:uncharacterized protein GSPATT00023747001 [Paramecium tetraurelia]CAK91019.1 unnamed protein product [Paramecium tetraurelia]|eukprot:XP_001458416.1 hypothetical protein (macronuclear) [Paramecium tetraurelia strain d4-2]